MSVTVNGLLTCFYVEWLKEFAWRRHKTFDSTHTYKYVRVYVCACVWECVFGLLAIMTTNVLSSKHIY